MTVLTEVDRITYTADGVTFNYAYNFEIPRSDEVIVTLDQVATSAYTISGIGNPIGGMVVLDNIQAPGVIVLIVRDVPITQLTDLLPFDPFPAETIEKTFDRIVFMIQKLFGSITNSYTKSTDTPSDVSVIVPKPVPGLFWTWDSLGQNIEYIDITLLAGQVIPTASDTEIINGFETQARLLSPFQAKLAVQTHETAPIMDVTNAQWLSVVDVLPGVLVPNHVYYVKQ